jgi:hypothetical protein
VGVVTDNAKGINFFLEPLSDSDTNRILQQEDQGQYASDPDAQQMLAAYRKAGFLPPPLAAAEDVSGMGGVMIKAGGKSTKMLAGGADIARDLGKTFWDDLRSAGVMASTDDVDTTLPDMSRSQDVAAEVDRITEPVRIKHPAASMAGEMFPGVVGVATRIPGLVAEGAAYGAVDPQSTALEGAAGGAVGGLVGRAIAGSSKRLPGETDGIQVMPSMRMETQAENAKLPGQHEAYKWIAAGERGLERLFAGFHISDRLGPNMIRNNKEALNKITLTYLGDKLGVDTSKYLRMTPAARSELRTAAKEPFEALSKMPGDVAYDVYLLEAFAAWEKKHRLKFPGKNKSKNIINRLSERIEEEGGSMTMEEVMMLGSELTNMIGGNKLKGVRSALFDLRDTFDDWAIRHTPATKEDFQTARDGYSWSQVVKNSTNAGGDVQPNKLASELDRLDRRDAPEWMDDALVKATNTVTSMEARRVRDTGSKLFKTAAVVGGAGYLGQGDEDNDWLSATGASIAVLAGLPSLYNRLLGTARERPLTQFGIHRATQAGGREFVGRSEDTGGL